MSEAVVTARQQADGTTIVDVRGILDASTVDGMRTTLLGTLHNDRPRQMIVDLMFVTFMDATGIGLLVAGHESARELGTRLVLRNPSEFVHHQLRITGLTRLFGLAQGPTAPAWRV